MWVTSKPSQYIFGSPEHPSAFKLRSRHLLIIMICPRIRYSSGTVSFPKEDCRNMLPPPSPVVKL